MLKTPPTFGSPFDIGSGFAQPSGVAVDAMAVAVHSNGTVYVADYGNSRVEGITPDGTQSTAVSQLSAPSGLAVDSAGNVYIADTGGHDYQKLDVSSDTISIIASGVTLPPGVAVDAAGAVYGVDGSTSGNAVTKCVAGLPPEVLPIPGCRTRARPRSTARATCSSPTRRRTTCWW